jgi:hypothetical protein
VIGTVRPIIETVTAETDPVTQPVIGTVRPIIETVTAETDPVTQPVIRTVRPVIETVTAGARPIAQPVTRIPRPVIETVRPDARRAAEPVTRTARTVLEVVAGGTRPVLQPAIRTPGMVLETITAGALPVAQLVTRTARPILEAAGASALSLVRPAVQAVRLLPSVMVDTVSALNSKLSRWALLGRPTSSSHAASSPSARAAGAAEGRWKIATLEWLPTGLVSSWSGSFDHSGGSGSPALPPGTAAAATAPLASWVTRRGDSQIVLRRSPLSTASAAFAQGRAALSLDATASHDAATPFRPRRGAEQPTGVFGPAGAGGSGASQSEGFAAFPTAMLPTALGLGRWLRPTPDLMPRRQHVPAIEVPG